MRCQAGKGADGKPAEHWDLLTHVGSAFTNYVKLCKTNIKKKQKGLNYVNTI